MTALSVQPPYPIFTDIDGQPLENGYVWIGAVNLDPQTNPITVYWDAGLTIAAAQPIRTLAGYPSNNGTPARIYTGSDYSIRVQNKNGSVVYSAPTATERYSNIVTLASISFTQAGAGAVTTTALEKTREWVSPADFGAAGNANSSGSSGTNDSFAFTALEANYQNIVVNLEGKTYLVDSPIPHANQYINGRFVVAQSSTDDQPVICSFGSNTLKDNTFIPRQFPSSTLTWAAGNFNTAFGNDTMVSNTTGRRNTAIGANCFRQNTAGFYNTVVGSWAAYSNTTGNYNTVVGNQSLQFNTTGNNNTVVGEGSLVANVTGSNNVVVGDTAAVSVNNGSRNVVIGSQALKNATATLNDIVAIGYQALSFTNTGVANLAIGTAVLGSNTTGSNNAGVGYRALQNNSTGYSNTAMGVDSLITNTTGYRNTAFGKSSLADNTAGSQNTAIGNLALNASTGDSNTAVGDAALVINTTGIQNTAVGQNAGSSQTTLNNTSAIGFNAQPTASNQVKLGNTSVTQINLGNNLIIDVAQILTVSNGTLYVSTEGGIKYIRAID
jgi:hypothetical protein